MRLVHRLPLLLLLGALPLNSDAKKVMDILKKLGKRYQSSHSTLLTEAYPATVKEERNTELAARTDEEVRHLKMTQMQKIGQWLADQTNNPLFIGEWLDKLLQLFSPEMTATICGSDKVLNYYEFSKYLPQSRKGYKNFLVGGSDPIVTYELIDSPRGTLQFTATYNATTTMGLVTKMSYTISAQFADDILLDWCEYLITKVDVLGDCPSNGNVQGELLSQQAVWKESTDVQQLLRMFSEEVTPLHAKQLPRGWLRALEPSGENTTSITCTSSPGYNFATSEQFIKWYDKLDVMWHPKGDLKSQILELWENTRIKARITMPLQLGWNETEPVHEWEFQIRALFNSKGDKKWYISHVHVHCPLGMDIAQEYIRTFPMVSGEHFASRVNDKVQWFSALDYLYRFLSDPYEIQACRYTKQEGKLWDQVDNVARLEQYLWKGRSWYNGTLVGYSVEDKWFNWEPKPPHYEHNYEMRIAMRQWDAPSHKYNYEAVWKFYVEYSDVDMFMYIKKIEFGCMEKTQVAFDSCKWKLCKALGT